MNRLLGFWQEYKKDSLAVVGLLILSFYILIAILSPYISPFDPFELSNDITSSPSLRHIMGTDDMGRDVFSRVLWGTRIALVFVSAVGATSMVIGVTLGAIAGYYGGLVDDLISRFIEVFMMIPRLFLIILVVAMFGANVFLSIAIISITMWPSNAKVTRAQVLSLKEREFVQAAIGLGVSDVAIIFRHILPNCFYPVVVNSTMQMARTILLEASLSFLGVGDPNQVSWGQMIYLAQIKWNAWWLAIFPGIAMIVLTLGFNLIGDGINHVLNPKLGVKW